MQRSAVLDDSGLFRYRLTRVWEDTARSVVFVMLNPSTADAGSEDPTIRRCMGLSRRWGYGRLEVVNLFAWRGPEPAALRTADDPVGPDNDRWIREIASGADAILLAWGNAGRLHDRDREVLAMLDEIGSQLWCLGLTAQGCPRHPLYIRTDARRLAVTASDLAARQD